jgi:hypothetical protein
MELSTLTTDGTMASISKYSARIAAKHRPQPAHLRCHPSKKTFDSDWWRFHLSPEF